jgi:Na+/proline symporter
MSPKLILLSFLAYTLLLFIISWITSRKAGNEAFFVGNRVSPWVVVAYGMIGTSLSGVTFIFLLSRIIGASFRMFLVVNVLQLFVFDAWGVPFWVTVTIFMILILLYTFKGGIKTIVWTDTLQTTFMLLAVVFSVVVIARHLNTNFSEISAQVLNSDYSEMFFFNWQDKRFFLKQFFSGVFIAIVMTGLDQDMMQKNLSCRNLKDAQKNMISLSFILVFVNLLFLFLGAILYIYANSKGITIPDLTDDLFPTVALKYLGTFAGVIFIIGLISAAYSSADSALTALTTSFSIDFLGFNKNKDLSEKRKINIRYIVHFCIATLVIFVIVIFRVINDQAVISKLFTIAGYTYGPLLVSPVICYIISENSEKWFNGYKFGFELLILNGIITFVGLYLIKNRFARQ